MQAVARRAEVAPGTVLNHFPHPDQLVRAVIAKWSEEIVLPSPADIDSESPLGERLRTLFTSVYRLYEQTGAVYEAIGGSTHPAVAESVGAWEATLGEMLGRALGDDAAQEDAIGIVSAFLDPRWWELLAANLPDYDLAEIAASMAAHWIEGSQQG